MIDKNIASIPTIRPLCFIIDCSNLWHKNFILDKRLHQYQTLIEYCTKVWHKTFMLDKSIALISDKRPLC